MASGQHGERVKNGDERPKNLFRRTSTNKYNRRTSTRGRSTKRGKRTKLPDTKCPWIPTRIGDWKKIQLEIWERGKTQLPWAEARYGSQGLLGDTLGGLGVESLGKEEGCIQLPPYKYYIGIFSRHISPPGGNLAADNSGGTKGRS